MGTWRGRGLALSLIALLLQMMIPAGYMVSDGPSGPALVICTGHGPLLSSADPGHPGNAPPVRPDMPCAFAGHGVLATPALSPVVAAASISGAPTLAQPQWDLTPGRGLAAPPPPSQGPPRSI